MSSNSHVQAGEICHSSELSLWEKPFWIKGEITNMLTNMRPFFPHRDPQVSNHKTCKVDAVMLKTFSASFSGSRRKEKKRSNSYGNIWLKMVHHHPGFHSTMPSKLTDKKREMDPSAFGCAPPFLSILPNSIPQCTCLVRERQGKRREGIPFDLDRHANVGGHATAMEHPTAQQHRGPGSLTARVSL